MVGVVQAVVQAVVRVAPPAVPQAAPQAVPQAVPQAEPPAETTTTTTTTTTYITGPGGDVQQTFTSSLGGAGMLGITTGDLPSTITGDGPGSIFQTAQWDTFTSNNMVGPEFGMMFEGSQGAWDWYAGGSFTAGFNWQNNIYKGANLPQNLGADYLRTNFAGGGVTTINFLLKVRQRGVLVRLQYGFSSNESVNRSQCFQQGNQPQRIRQSIDLRSLQLVSGDLEDGTGFRVSQC